MQALKNPWWIVFGSVIGLIVGNVTILQFSTSVLMKPIMAEFGWPRTVPSAAVGLGSLFAAIATPFVGRRIDRHGIRPVTLAAITLFAMATAAMSVAPAYAPMFLVMFSVVGLFSGGQAPLPYAKSIAAAFDARRGVALGVAMTGVGLGAALMPKLAQVYLEQFGWRGAFVALGVTVFAVAFPAVALFLREPAARGAAAREGAAALPGLTAQEVVRTRNFWIMAIVFTCIPIVANGIIFHLVALLTDRGIPASRAVAIFAAIGPSLIAGRLLCGWLLDRLHGPYVAVAFIVLPALGVLLLLSGSDPGTTAAGAVLVGLGLGAEVDLIGYLQSRYFGLRAFGQVYGYLFAIFTVGTGIGPFVMGATFDLSGSYRPVLMAFFVVLVAAAIAMLRLPRKYPFPVQGAGSPLIGHTPGVAPRKERHRMKLVTFNYRGKTSIGKVEGNTIIDLPAADSALPSSMRELLRAGVPMMERARAARGSPASTVALADAQLLAPLPDPSKYLAIGMNYRKHVAEAAKVGVQTPPTQVWFNKQVSCIVGPRADVHLPRVSDQLDYEVELGIVIGRRCRHVKAEEALSVIAGYLVCNDVSVRDWQLRTPTMTIGKSFDTCGPTGPWIVTADEVPDPQSLRMRLYVNDELRQDDITSGMIHGIAAQIAYLSTAFTLEPGDLIATGTPSGVGVAMDPPRYLRAGDVMRAEIEGIGTLENRVVPEPA